MAPQDYRVSRNRHLVGGALTDAGSLYQWFSRTLKGSLSHLAYPT